MMSEHSSEEQTEMVEGFSSPIKLTYNFAAGAATSKFLNDIKKGRIVGQRSNVTGFVSVPPRGACPISGTPMTEEVELPETGTVVHLRLCIYLSLMHRLSRHLLWLTLCLMNVIKHLSTWLLNAITTS